MKLTPAQRDLVKLLRENRGLTQQDAGKQAWPHRTDSGARANWARLESDNDNSLSLDSLESALAVVGMGVHVSISVL